MAGKNLFVFGDSLSDTDNSFTFTKGFIPPSPPYFNGRFSNGAVAVEILAAQPNSGLTLDPNNNFAFGGATTGRSNSNEDDLGVDLPGLQDQIDEFAARVGAGGADANGLYIVWAGPNNFLDTLGGSVPADPAVLLQQGTIDLITATKTLENLGANDIVLPNMVNLGRLPATEGTRTEATAISKAFNASVALALGNLEFDVTEVDLFSAGEAVAANPGNFGFTNVTDPLLFLQLSLTPPSNPEQFFFWDQFHPTTQGHAVFADTIDRTLTGAIPQLQFTARQGTNKNDSLFGTSGNDNMDGFGGGDLLVGRSGADRMEGWSGNDQLWSGQGNDILNGGEGADLIQAGLGQDIGFGGGGNDSIFGLSGDDILVGDAGNDKIDGGEGNDYLLGGEGDDLLSGNIGADIINGGGGADLILGGIGDDILNGGTDTDQLTGGIGKDQFVYRSRNGLDRILDFTRGRDKIDLTSFNFDDFADFTGSVSLNRNSINFGSGDILRLVGLNASSLAASDFLFG